MTDKPLGFNLNDLGKVLEGAVTPAKRRRTTTSRSSSSSNDMDAALRRAVRVELEDTNRAIKDLTDEVTRLRKSNEDLLAKLARLARG
jgi:phage-related tail protein